MSPQRNVVDVGQGTVEVIEVPAGPAGPPGPPGDASEQRVYFGATAPTVPGPWIWYETDPVVGLVDIHVEAAPDG